MKLEDALVSLDDPDKMSDFLKVILTAKEIDNLRNRWASILMLRSGATQRHVKSELKMAISTVSRSSAALNMHEELINEIVNDNGQET